MWILHSGFDAAQNLIADRGFFCFVKQSVCSASVKQPPLNGCCADPAIDDLAAHCRRNRHQQIIAPGIRGFMRQLRGNAVECFRRVSFLGLARLRFVCIE
jgi:hypothetical protein